jgi:8-oxo-dGTP diphosphatase
VKRVRSSWQRLAYRAFGQLPSSFKSRVVHLLKPTFTVGTLTWIERDAQVLLVRNAQRHGWGMPGGLLDRDEHADVGAVREVSEETGLLVAIDGPGVAVVIPGPRRVDLAFVATSIEGTVQQASGEILELRWWPIGALPPLQHNSAEAYSALVRAGRIETNFS